MRPKKTKDTCLPQLLTTKTYRLSESHIEKIEEMTANRMRKTGKVTYPAEVVREAIDRMHEQENRKAS